MCLAPRAALKPSLGFFIDCYRAAEVEAELLQLVLLPLLCLSVGMCTGDWGQQMWRMLRVFNDVGSCPGGAISKIQLIRLQETRMLLCTDSVAS